MVDTYLHQPALAIDTTLPEGSICLFNNGRFHPRTGPDISRAGSLLPSILELLNANAVSIADLVVVGVTLGPGSYTGTRIGISTVLGLSSSMDIDCMGVTTTEAVGYGSTSAVMIPVGRGRYAVYLPEDLRNSPRIVGEASDILSFVESGAAEAYLLPYVNEPDPELSRLIEAGNVRIADEPVSQKVCRLVHAGVGTTILDPVYLTPSNAANDQ